jgi:hypothetical protein
MRKPEKNVDESGSDLIICTFPAFAPRDARKSLRTSVRTIGVLAEIRTWHRKVYAMNVFRFISLTFKGCTGDTILNKSNLNSSLTNA